MTEYNEGDLVEAVKGTDVRRGLVTTPSGHLHAKLQSKCLHNYEAEGWTLTVIEKAAPKNVLPTEAGFYVGDYDRSPSGKILIELLGTAEWVDNTDSRYLDVEWVQKLGNLTRLEPVPVTAAKVIDATLANVDPQLGAYWHDKIRAVGAQFGVDL